MATVLVQPPSIIPWPFIQTAQSTIAAASITTGLPARITGSLSASPAELPRTFSGDFHDVTYAHGYSLPSAAVISYLTISRACGGRSPAKNRSRAAGRLSFAVPIARSMALVRARYRTSGAGAPNNTAHTSDTYSP